MINKVSTVTNINEPEEFLEEDIEIEDLEIEEGKVKEPFDPSKIRVDTRSMTIDSILRKIKFNEIELHPEFQRQVVWNNIAKSRLIESILIRMPIPIFYIDATNEEKWLIIDGLQRLTSLKEFILDKSLKLVGLQSFTEFNGKIYDDLPRNYQRRIEETYLVCIILEKGTPKEFSQLIFERINTTSSSLSLQEIRHALNQGKATKLLEILASSAEFKIATKGGIASERMTDRECILRVLVFMINFSFDKSIKSMKTILDKTMEVINLMSNEEVDKLKNNFLRVMNIAFEILGNNAFRKVYDKGIRKPVNKALFEAWSVNLYRLNEEEIECLKHRRDILERKIIEATNKGEFDKPIYRITGTFKDVLLRLSDIERIIKSALL
jgi:hypothetical protein